MTLKPVLTFAHSLLSDVVATGDTVIDCTMGNGHDTLLLANLVGEAGHVLAFDIQQSALESTRTLLVQHSIAPERATLIKASHANVAAHIPKEMHGRVKAAIFNLGYLPGGDKRICTAPHTTIQAVEALLSLLAPGGVIVLVVYQGHAEGVVEATQLVEYCTNLPHSSVNAIKYQILNKLNNPPFVIALEKLGEQ